MKAGEMRHWIRFEEMPEYPQKNEFGEAEGVPLVVHQCFAKVEALSGREFFSAEAVQSEVTHNITTRYVPGITTKQTIRFGEHKFDILSAIDPDGRGRELRIRAKELQ
jgi:SPP1 family predicted phage head-tail adaptor